MTSWSIRNSWYLVNFATLGYMKPVKRLLTYFQPKHYTLKLDIDRPSRRYRGTVSISGTKRSDNDLIMLHAKDITITSVQIDDAAIPYILHDNELQIDAKLQAGEYLITIEFSGPLRETMLGMYISHYMDGATKKELVVTQFESHFARTVFPCIDEPAAKATFDLTLITEPDVIVLSNMPIRHEIAANNRLTTQFETTPRMSTYLLAWVYGELHHQSMKTARGVLVNAYATTVQPIDSVTHGLAVAVRTIDFFEHYYDTKYPLPKCDLVALPDFSAAAMENWGLITFRESCLLARDTTTTATREYIATVIAHELAHQWFGNLVTMKWWDNLWLNESFANVMMFTAIDVLYPEWHIWRSFMNSEISLALERDQFPMVQPIELPIHHPDEINAAFDKGIVYAKGSRVLRMLESYIGPQAFQHGLKTYFDRHAYGNTTSDDLWRAMSDASGKDIRGFMTPWIQTSGYPLITVSPDGSTRVRLSQQQFTIDHSASTTYWPVPFQTKNGTQLMTSTETILPARDINIPINHEAQGHFMTLYDDPYAQIFLTALQHNQLEPSERGSSLYEYYLLAQAGYTSTERLIEVLWNVRHESVDAIWSVIDTIIRELHKHALSKDDLKIINQWIHTYTQPTRLKLGYTEQPNDSINDMRIRAIILNLLVLASHPETIDTLADQYQSSVDITSLPSTLRSVICSAALHKNSQATYRSINALYQSTLDPEIRDHMTIALCTTDDPSLITTLLDQLHDVSYVKPQDTVRWYSYLLRNPVAQELTWQWLEQHWDWILHTFGDDHALEKFVVNTARIVSGAPWIDRYTKFFDAAARPDLARSIKIGTLSIKAKTDWISRDHDRLMHTVRATIDG